jgi:hypothetical protein
MMRCAGSGGCAGILCAFAACVLSIAAPAFAQRSSSSNENELLAKRIATAPVIDGRDDDAAWKDGPISTDFRDFAPREGIAPSVRTSVRIRYDDRALYILVRAFDPAPDSIVRRSARRDTFDATADQILIFLDPFHDARTGFEFDVSASGVKADAAIFDDTSEDYSWDGVWDAATHTDSLGWIAEIAIPFSQLRFADRRAPVFGIIVGRWIARSGERMSIPQYSRAKAGLVSQMGRLEGLHDVATSSALEATPYMLARVRSLPVNESRQATLQTRPSVGADVRWVPEPSVSVDATVNPDFGQVEADPASVNLTGVEIYQTEKRPFFVDGAGLLALPLATDGSAQLFDSRRIGRRPSLYDTFGAADSPTETSILGAAKVTARLTSSTSIAALTAVTGEVDGRARGEREGAYVIEPHASDLVARVQQDFRGGRSGVGLMITDIARDRPDSISASLLPASARALALATQHQSRDGAYQATGWLASSDVRGSAAAISTLQLSPVHAFQRPDDGVFYDSTRDDLHGSAAFVSLAKVAGGITRFSSTYRRIGPAFDVNDLGFLTTSGVQDWSSIIGIDQNRPGSVARIPYRRANVSLGYSGEWSTTGLAFGRALSINSVLQLSNLSQLQATVSQQLPGGFCELTCTRGGPALVDPPRSTAIVDFTGDPRHAFLPHTNVEYDRDDEGRTYAVSASMDGTWRVRSDLELSLAIYAFNAHYDWYFYGSFGSALSDTTHYTVARLDLATRSLTPRLNYALTTTLTLQWYAQAYISRGAYSDVREIVDPRSRDERTRFRPYADSAVRSRPGGVDFKQLRSNMVMRWEYRPGSTLFVVWSQGRDLDATDPARLGLWPGRDLRGLFALWPQNTIAVKLSYWMRR